MLIVLVMYLTKFLLNLVCFFFVSWLSACHLMAPPLQHHLPHPFSGPEVSATPIIIILAHTQFLQLKHPFEVLFPHHFCMSLCFGDPLHE